MRSRSIRVAGLVLVCLGAVVLVGPTFGFETLGANRAVSADTAADPSALLGVVDDSAAGAADVTPPDQEGIVYYLDDNGVGVSASDVTATAVSFDGQATDLHASVEPDSGSHDFRIVVTCGSSTRNAAGRLTVDIAASTPDASISMERTTDATIDVNCRSASGQGFASASASDLLGGSQQTIQTFTFEPQGNLGAQSQVVLDLSAARAGILDYGNATVAAVTRNGNGPAGSASFADSQTLVYSPQGATGDQITIEVDGITIEQAWTFASYDVDVVRTDTNVATTVTFSAVWFDFGGFGGAATQSAGRNSLDGRTLDGRSLDGLSSREARALANARPPTGNTTVSGS